MNEIYTTHDNCEISEYWREDVKIFQWKKPTKENTQECMQR